MTAPEMMVWVDFSFDAAHRLPMMPPSHKCHRLHGHTYRVRLWFAGPVDPTTGFVIDYAMVKACVDPLIAQLDHYTLNDVDGLAQPTCEHIALWLAERIGVVNLGRARLVELHIQETERAGVTLRLEAACS
jgi:6-pyruvoyltetrahydropterin/6-carboxytetrahydropterin synthase